MRNITQHTANDNGGKNRFQKLLTTSALVAAGFAVTAGPAKADNWTDHQAVSGGTIEIDTSVPSTTNITQYGDMVKVQGDGDINAGWTVNVAQPSSDAKYVLFDIENDPTVIMGTLNANGQIYIFDQNGTIFGDGSVVNVGSIVTSTGSISDENLASGNMQIENIADGAITIGENATITVADAGLAAFVAPTVSNAGVINARMGTVAMAAGETVTLDMYGDGLVEVAVDGELADALVENSGTINANGGTVQITARAAKNVVDNIINVSGVVDVSSVEQQGGKIVLSGGDKGKVAVSGNLNATGATGGDVTITGQFVSADAGAVVDVSGTNGGGNIKFGGAFQGGGDTPTAEYAYMDQAATFRANADEDGDGGEVIVWADKATGFFGTILARGGANSGNGGFVETSGKDYLEAHGSVDASAANGEGGEWLLDPRNLEVTTFNDDVGGSGVNPFIITAINFGGGNTSQVDNETIQNSLNGGTSVTLRTADHDDGEGDITVNATITKSNGGNATLRMESHDDIIVNQVISSTAGQLSVELLAGVFENGTPNPGSNNDIEINANISTRGGNFLAQADDDIFVNATVNTNNVVSGGKAGDITLRGLGDLGSSDVNFNANGYLLAVGTGSNALEGNILIEAQDLIIDTSGTAHRIDAADGGTDANVTIRRSTSGTIGLGSAAGDMQISQAELAKIDAGSLTVGGANTTFIGVTDANTTTSTVSGLVTLQALGNAGADILLSGNNVFNSLLAQASDEIAVGGGASVTTNGSLEFAAGDNIWIDGDIDTNGGNARFGATNDFAIDNDDDTVTTDGGNVQIFSDQIRLGVNSTFNGSEVAINAGTGNVLIDRATSGTFMLGGDTGLGGLHLAQNELAAIDAASLTIGNPVLADNHIYAMTVWNADSTTGTITGPVNLNVLRGNSGNYDDVRFFGTNVFNGLNINVNDSVIIDAGATVDSYGDVSMSSDTNDQTVGYLFTRVGSALRTHGNNLVVNVLQVVLDAASHIDAQGGNIDLNNSGLFYSVDAGSVRTSGTGTIAMNQNDDTTSFFGILGDILGTSTLTGHVWNAVAAFGNTGTGQNTLDVYAGSGDGVYTDEAIDVQQHNLKLNGVTGEGIVLVGNGTDEVIDVNAANFNLDPVTVDANGAAYGLVAIDAGANGLIVDGNTFVNTGGIGTIAGIFVSNSTGGTGTIENNIFEGSTVRGIQLGAMSGGSTLNVENNTFGSAIIGKLANAIRSVGAISGGSTVNITNGNTAYTYADALWFTQAISGGSTVNIDDITIDTDADGIQFDGALSGASTISITNSDVDASVVDQNAVEINGNISGDSNVYIVGNNDGFAAGNHGIFFGGSISGSDIDIHDNIIAANLDDGVIGSGIYFGGTIGTSTVDIGAGSRDSDPSNFITVGSGPVHGNGDTDGIHFAAAINSGADINIDGNRIGYTGTPNVNGQTAATLHGDGIEFTGAINSGASVDIGDNHINAGGNNNGSDGDGVVFSGHINGGANVLVGGSSDGNIINAADDGVEFNGINGGSVEVSENSITAGDIGVVFNAGSPSIQGGAIVNIINNTINAVADGVFVQDDVTGGGTTLNIKKNTITAGDEGIDIDNVRNGATVNIGGPGGSDGNRITADGNGIEFDAGIDATVLVQKNRISAGGDGVNVRDDDDGHTTAIDTGANVKILDNKIGSEGSDSIGGHGINVEEAVTGNSYVEIARNDIGSASNPVNLDGIHFGGAINGGSTVYIHDNNHGIHADDHGIYFGGAINGGATVDIDDNIIGANEDNGVIGSGIFFDGVITNATINIGDGSDSFTSGASNIIRVADPDGSFGWDVSNLDGIHFNKEVGQGADINIDGNRLGYNANSVGGSLSNERLPGDGIEFRGPVTGNADISVTDNFIRADQDGIRFAGIIKDFAKILIGGSGDRNVIDANDNGIEFEEDVTGQSLVEISYNEVTADNDGVLFGDTVNNAKTTGGTSENEILIKNNTIWGGNNGVHFAGEIDGSAHDTLITGNNIEGENGQGIVFDEDIDEAHVKIVGNTRIEGQVDGVRFLGDIEDGARIDINDNTSIEGIDHEAIHFFGEIDESTVNIVGNDNLEGGDHGVEFDGLIDDSSITISENNHGIHADNHGIVFFANIDDSTLNIHDNIISANENNNGTGDGIHFGGKIIDSNVYIGDGAGPDYYDNPSNIITGWDGIHFDDDIEGDSYIKIDGNRLGYYKTSGGTHQNAKLDDDGIQFIGDIEDSSEIKITENRIQADDDGISFIGKVRDWAEVTIGGESGKGNKIFADDDGIQFEEEIKDNALVEISYNDIEADDNGIQFDAKTSNYRNGHDEEILIKKNTVEAGRNGIIFYGKAEGSKHDIVIRDNYKVHGNNGHGIAHVGNIDDAELWILDNDNVYGREDGIHVVGQFYNDAKIKIDDNTVDSGWDDGIHVEDTGNDWGADVDVVHNHVHNTGDDGIFVKNIEDALIGWNEVHNTNGNGIYGSNIDGGQILGNEIYDTDENGIKVNPSDYVDIAYNNIHDADWDGIRVDGGDYADIWDNHVGDVGDDGIDVNDNDHVDIWDNYIHNTGKYDSDGNGIEVSDSYRADIKHNTVRYAGDDGIEVDDSRYVDIKHNTIYRAGDDGIDVDDSDYADIKSNDISKSGGDGIQVRDSDHVDIKWNDIWFSGDDGIDFEDGAFGRIWGNDVYFSRNNGIEVEDSAFISINWNDVFFSGDAGIFVDPSWFIDVIGNNVQYNVFGIHFDDVTFGRIKDNTVKNNWIGIKLEDSHKIDVKANFIANNFVGLWAYGGDNGYIKVRNNLFLHNPIGAKFNSGLIDLSGEDNGNTFIGGDIALYFDAWHNKFWKLALVDDDAPGYDTFDGVNVFPPTNYGGTIGYQTFKGQDDYFVKVGSHTFIDGYGGPAIWLNGLNSSYYWPSSEGGPDDFITPSDTGGILTPQQLAFLEDMFFHWPDVQNRGIFFFGRLADDIPNVEEADRRLQVNPFDSLLSGLNVTITGLPGIGGPGANLAGIAPAAGPGATADDLAGIEPAAGGEDTPCWDAAVGNAGAGTPSSISWGGTTEESLSDAAACGGTL